MRSLEQKLHIWHNEGGNLFFMWKHSWDNHHFGYMWNEIRTTAISGLKVYD